MSPFTISYQKEHFQCQLIHWSQLFAIIEQFSYLQCEHVSNLINLWCLNIFNQPIEQIVANNQCSPAEHSFETVYFVTTSEQTLSVVCTFSMSEAPTVRTPTYFSYQY